MALVFIIFNFLLKGLYCKEESKNNYMVEHCNNSSEENMTLGTCNMPCIISGKKHSKCHGMHEVWISYEAGNYIEHSN